MNHLFHASLTKAINTYLDLDPESKQRLKKLNGKVITIEFLPVHFIFQCVFSETRVSIHHGDMLETDTKICGTPLQMLGVMLTKENRQRFFAEDVMIEGNAEFAQQVTELFDELEIDWEEHLSRLIGDVPAYHAGQFMKKIRSWFTETDDSISQDINDYIHEEAQWLPTREALQDFFADIDMLRMDVDRVEARVKNLQAFILKDEVTE